MAKNSKGLAQNELEISSVNDSFYGSIFAKVFEYDENNQWLEMELVTKVTESNFKQAVGYDFKKFCYQLLETVGENTKKNYSGVIGDEYAPDEDEKEKMFYDDEMFFYNVVDYVMAMKIPPQELTQITAWGLVKRNGYDSIVLVDYGFNEDVAKNHYGFK